METGYDIIFFWVARMMMLGLHLTDQEPFHTVYLSGLIRDPEGQKMSKTKGNVVDPLSVIDTAGADALRFAVIHGAAPGQDQRMSPAKLDNARNFANKLWNAARFVVGARPASIPEGAERRLPDARHLGPAERWLLSRAAATTTAVDAAVADYGFGEMTRILYDAIWNEYCDWGLELAKVRLADESLDPAVREATWWTLVEVLDTYLRLLHPVMPFVTEALWAALPHRASDPDLLIVARWPAALERDPEAEAEVGTIVALITEIRNARATANVPAGAMLEARVHVPLALGGTFEALRPAVERLARVRPLHRELTRRGAARVVRAGRPGGGRRRRGGGGVGPTGDDRCGRRGPGSRAPRARARRRGGLAGRGAGPARQRGVHGQGAARRGRGRARPRGGAGRAGRPAARAPRPLGTTRRDRWGRTRNDGRRGRRGPSRVVAPGAHISPSRRRR